MESLEGRIDEELVDLHARIDGLNKEAESARKQHESRESRHRCLDEMSGKYVMRIEGLEKALLEGSGDGADVTWEQLQQQKERGELSERGKALLELHEKGQDERCTKEKGDHRRLKAECLDLVDEINGRLLARLQKQ